MSQRESFSPRTAISICLALAALTLILSGVAVYIKPEGSVARALGWTWLGLSKGQWESVHTTLALLFVIMSFLHMYLNWGAFIWHLRRAIGQGAAARWEGVVAVVVVAGVVMLTLAAVPPLSTIVEFGDHIKAFWEAKVP